ncbi:MAG TPA: acetyl-CoA acetyltransferase [Candidatus Saccharimonadales bacterium]|nr:acetyl-CoA acetyltransferase [Candidatus Saccharimonadales bacterium]
MIADSTPILIGCGDVTDLTTPVEAVRSPFDLIAEAGGLALNDAGSTRLAQSIDVVAMLRLFSDTSHRFRTALGTSSNPPRSVARRLGINASRYLYTWNGGNMPQYMVNHLAEAIAQGEVRAAMIAGGEALRTQHGAEKAGLSSIWSEDPGGQPELIGNPRRGWSDCEDRHQMRAAITMYPLIENAIRGARGRRVAEHMQAMGSLLAGLSQVAERNPLATRRAGYSAERLATVDHENRWIGFPYPRLMNANAFIDQAAAIIMTSVGEARRLGVPENKWIYLHGCADADDHWYISERTSLHASPAIRWGVRKALEMARRTIADMRFFDLYSCFPSALEIACQETGLAEDDPRGLTVTGGLPYFGGPGNNYVTHSISEMMRRLRQSPGSFGLVTANGNYITKHSFGVYSTVPFDGPWRRESQGVLQAELNALPKAPFVEDASGAAVIETYTVMHGKTGPEFAVVMGRLKDNGHRFLANTPTEPALLLDLQERESLGRPGMVRHHGGRNVFVPE